MSGKLYVAIWGAAKAVPQTAEVEDMRNTAAVSQSTQVLHLQVHQAVVLSLIVS
jgi:hypothetical protein